MKRKTKTLVVVEIAIVLCSLFLVAIPAIVADQNQETQKVSASEVTTASEDDFVLEIYGNANEDDTIDMGDVVYTKLAIFGKKPKTELCDAKYDGRINVLDVIQTKLIILGKEKELTLIDTYEESHIITVKKPIKRMVVLYLATFETLRSLKVPQDIIVGVGSKNWDPVFFPETSELPNVGFSWGPDIEAILNLRPDFVIAPCSAEGDRGYETGAVLEAAGITVALFLTSTDHVSNLYAEETIKLGYIFDKEDEAEEYIDWRENLLNSIKERVEKIPEEDKPKVYFERAAKPYSGGNHRLIPVAGGKGIFAYLGGGSVDPEAVIERDPDIIIKMASPAHHTTGEAMTGGYGKNVEDTAELEEVRDEMMERPELQQVKAVKDGKVYILTYPVANTGPYGYQCGCRNFMQLAYMAKWFHPTLFEDLDPKAIHQEYITRFQGLDIDLDKKGVFVYPEPN